MLSAPIGPDLANAAEVMIKDYLAVSGKDTVLITADTSSDMAVVEAILNCADMTGAKTVVMIIPPLPFQGTLADPYISEPLAAAMKQCDVWVDLTFPYLAGSNAWDKAMAGKRTRYCLCGDLKGDSMVRMFSKVDLDALFRVQKAFAEITTKAVGKTCRLTNSLGSDLTFTLDKSPYPKPRRAKTPGMYTVPGAHPLWPVYDSVKGVITVDTAFHEYYTAMPSPMVLEIDGRVRKVTGGGAEQKVMDRALKRAAGGKNYGYVIHFTCGLQPAARYTRSCFVEDQRVMANNAVGLGIPFWQPGGGENHPDAVMSQQSIWIDGKHIMDEGTFVGSNKPAKLADALQPLYN